MKATVKKGIWEFEQESDDECWGDFLMFVVCPIFKSLKPYEPINLILETDKSKMQGQVTHQTMPEFVYLFLKWSGFGVGKEEIKDFLEEEY